MNIPFVRSGADFLNFQKANKNSFRVISCSELSQKKRIKEKEIQNCKNLIFYDHYESQSSLSIMIRYIVFYMNIRIPEKNDGNFGEYLCDIRKVIANNFEKQMAKKNEMKNDYESYDGRMTFIKCSIII